MSQQATAKGLVKAGGEHWLTESRLTVYPRIFLAVFAVSVIAWVLASQDLVDPNGKPLGYDFVTFWAASHLTLGGEPASAFDLARIFEAERSAVAGVRTIYAWHYPPTFQLVTAPLALLPYIASYLVWTLATLVLCGTVIRGLAPGPHTLPLFLAFSATFLNFAQGQTGFLTAALFGGSLLLLERRPVSAGILIGLLSLKPHVGVLIPLALVAGRRWIAFIAAAATVVAFAATSVLVLGPEVWVAFWQNLPILREILEQGGVPWAKMTSLFAALRLLGLGVWPAYMLQLLLALAVALIVARLWWRGVRMPLAAAALASAALLVTPYVFDYDLVLLAVPIALLARDGREHGWLPGDREILVAAWLAPLLSPVLAEVVGIQLGWLVVSAVLGVAARRAEHAQRDRAKRAPRLA